jgi:hypothetical protein
VTRSGAPVPPPASGPSQTLVPDLLGTPLEIETTTTATPSTTSTTINTVANAASIAAHNNGPNGLTLILAAIAWLASLGGLLVYVEDQKSLRWKHLAR